MIGHRFVHQSDQDHSSIEARSFFELLFCPTQHTSQNTTLRNQHTSMGILVLVSSNIDHIVVNLLDVIRIVNTNIFHIITNMHNMNAVENSASAFCL